MGLRIESGVGVGYFGLKVDEIRRHTAMEIDGSQVQGFIVA